MLPLKIQQINLLYCIYSPSVISFLRKKKEEKCERAKQAINARLFDNNIHNNCCNHYYIFIEMRRETHNPSVWFLLLFCHSMCPTFNLDIHFFVLIAFYIMLSVYRKWRVSELCNLRLNAADTST